MKKMISMALVVAAMLSASVSASAQGRRGEVMKFRKGEVRKEIRFHKDCPVKMADKRMVKFDNRFDKHFPLHAKFAKYRKFPQQEIVIKL